MDLPHTDHLVVNLTKVRDYLLSESHPLGRHKATFFKKYGFSSKDPGVLIEALQIHARANPLSGTTASKYGTRYTVDGPLESPSGASVQLRTVWFVESNEAQTRLVTAYPLEEP